MTLPANAAQTTEWNAALGDKWARHQALMDELFAEYGARVLDAARLTTGDRVLDVGCGCGATALGAARRVGSEGSVVGVDLSLPMLERARARALEEQLGHVRFEQGDVQVRAFEAGAYDAVVSRFGVMFFDDPIVAFTNVRGALRDQGRLSFACWQGTSENPWIVWVSAVLSGVLTMDPMDGPDVPGPFSFADPERVRHILSASGFRNVAVDPLRTALNFGLTADEAARRVLLLGPASRALGKAEASVKERAVTVMRTAIAERETPAGFLLESNGWLVTARAG